MPQSHSTPNDLSVQTLEDARAERDALPPMLRQYVGYKDEYPDVLLLMQVGDFYEAFYDDAVALAKTLNVTLTSRDKNSALPVPMAGVPIAVVDGYIDRLVQAGFSVALVSQAEPSTGKGMVARKLDRIVTPGVRVLGTFDDGGSDAIVAALALGTSSDGHDEFTVAFADVQSGVIKVREAIQQERLIAELQRIAVTELIVPRRIGERVLDRRTGWVRLLEMRCERMQIKFRLTDRRSGKLRELSGLSGFAGLSSEGRGAVRLLLEYVDEVTVDGQLYISDIQTESSLQTMSIDAATCRTLELIENGHGRSAEGTLVWAVDRTCTAAGSRLLRRWVRNPLTSLEAIRRRSKTVSLFKAQPVVRKRVQRWLGQMHNLQRIAARTELGVVGPHELGQLQRIIEVLPQVQQCVRELECSDVERHAAFVAEIEAGLVLPLELAVLLAGALVENPPVHIKEGGIFATGYDYELDRLRELKSGGTAWIAELEAREREESGITSLKIKFNNVLGYFFDVTKPNVDKVPAHFIKKQSTTNSVRYVTEELARLEEEVRGADGERIARELSLFNELRAAVMPFTQELRRLAEIISCLDVLQGFGELCDQERYIVPELCNDGNLEIVDGRHPVLDQILRSEFVPNSLSLESDGTRTIILTGPNMGGKSTYLRQIGLIVVLAQIGCGVPAASARVGVVDAIFARIGASDDQLEGDSTFMVEMREAAHIVANATARSLVLIDELGRGTATTDGMAVAQAIVEWLVNSCCCRTLFATHFHELTELAQVLPGVANFSVGALDSGGTVVFTHEICEGPARQSYGLEVATLAGLPEGLVSRARQVLVQCQSKGTGNRSPVVAKEQLSMFGAPVAAPQAVPKDYSELKALRSDIAQVDVNRTTPLEALALLDRLRARASEPPPNS